MNQAARDDLTCSHVVRLLRALRSGQRDETQCDAVPEPSKAPELVVALDDATLDALAERVAARIRRYRPAPQEVS